MRIERSTIYLDGELTRVTVPEIARDLERLRKRRWNRLRVVDISAVSRVDSSGLGLLETLRDGGYRNTMQLRGANETVADVIDTFADEALPRQDEPNERMTFRDILAALTQGGRVLIAGLGVCGDVFFASVSSLVIPARHRKGAISEQIVAIGMNAVPIVATLSFIIGFILALQAAVQLERFGGAQFLADLMGLSMFREMAPLLTAIIVTGRTGSAMASEIGTMRVTNEIDALRAMGIRPLEYVVGPKFIAMTVAVPMLAMLSATVGILGGLIVSVTVAGQPAQNYINRVIGIMQFKDGVLLLIKSLIFGWAIAMIAVYCGMQVEGGAVEVGRATTNAVVATTFAVVLLNVVFSLTYIL